MWLYPTNNVGSSLSDLGRHQEALEYAQKALKIGLALFGENHPHVALSYNNVGSSLSDLGRHQEALEYAQKALKIWLAHFGENHPHVASSYNDVGLSLSDLGCHQEVLEYGQKSAQNQAYSLWRKSSRCGFILQQCRRKS